MEICAIRALVLMPINSQFWQLAKTETASFDSADNIRKTRRRDANYRLSESASNTHNLIQGTVVIEKGCIARKGDSAIMDTQGDKSALANNIEDSHKPLSNDLYSQPHDFLAAIREITGRNTDDHSENQANKKQFKNDDLASLEIVSHDPGASGQHQLEAPTQAAVSHQAATEQTVSRASYDLSSHDIARAWQDPEFRQSLSIEQIAGLPANPAGDVQYTSRTGNTANFVKLAFASGNDCSSDNCSSSNCSSSNCSSDNCSSSNCSSNNCSSANCGQG